MYYRDKSEILGRVLMDIISSVIYTKREGLMSLNDETELKLYVKEGTKSIHISRTGLPQGLSISSLLSTLVLELSNPPEGLTAFADDGAIAVKDKKVVEEWLKELN